MVEEGPYEILPYAEIEKLKKEVEDLRKKSASSGEILNSIDRLTKIIESMLHLFESAASSLEKEGEGSLGKKLDKIIEQNETIAESILSLVDMVKELQEEEPYITEKPRFVPPEPMSFEPTPRIEEPDFSMPPPSFERSRPRPTQPRGPPREPIERPVPGGPLPRREPMEGPIPLREGPVAMPTGSFKDLNFEKPRKGLFRKYRK